jgi:cell division protein FtsA
VVGIDVGSSTVSVVVGSCDGDQLVVLGCGYARHDGARKGVIATLGDVSDAIRNAAEEAEAMASVPVEVAVVGLGGPPVLGRPAAASVPVTGRDHTVSRDDVRRALSACAQIKVPQDYRVLDIIPCGFALDGQAGMEQPVGMPGTRLDASAFVLYTNKTHADTVEQAVNRGSVAVQRMIYEPMAAAEAVLTSDERDLGCLLLDIGFATTEWLLFADRAIVASGCLPVGGRHFTADLAAMLKTTTAAAEETKRMVGASLHREDLDTRAIEVPALGGDGNQVHTARFAAEVLHERGRDLFIGVHRILAEHHLEGLPRAGVVLTGGGARLEGLEELAESIFGHRVRLGVPRGLAGLAEPVSGPEWAVACGLIRLQYVRNEVYEERGSRGGLLTWIRHALGDIFEMGGGR